MTTTLRDSFNNVVHRFRPFGAQIETSSKASGTLTADCTPPKCGVKIPIEHWIDLASRLCLDDHSHDLEADFLPKINGSIRFKSEADVVAASALHLTYPVHAAYELVHPDLTVLHKVTRPGNRMSPSSRVDIAYFSGEPKDNRAPGNSENIFAVLEYKKFNGLVRNHFNKGIVSDYDTYTRTQLLPRFSNPSIKAVMILKQAAHYAGRFGSHFVALCDYNTLILLVMLGVEGRHAGPYTYITVVVDPGQMRKAYLGFLLAAKAHKDKNTEWRKNRDGRDVFEFEERWELQRQSEEVGLERKARNSRNPDPLYVAPDSDDNGS